MTSAKENTAPAATFRMKGVSVAVYANQIKGQPVPLFKVSIKKNVFAKGEFKSVSSLGRDDLPVARHLLEQAWLAIIDLEAKARKDSAESSQVESSDDESAED
jgi:O-glycosyl hydrolase